MALAVPAGQYVPTEHVTQTLDELDPVFGLLVPEQELVSHRFASGWVYLPHRASDWHWLVDNSDQQGNPDRLHRMFALSKGCTFHWSTGTD
jgi:hypothetical protein